MTETTKVYESATGIDNKHEQWFSQFIDSINTRIATDKVNLERGDASKETVDFYKSLIEGDYMKTMSVTRNNLSNSIIREMVLYYLKLLNEKGISLSKLAIDISTYKVLVWAEIKANDENSEMGLIRIESIVNGKYGNDTGINIDSIIVEDCDMLPVPAHYNLVSI